MPILPSNIRLLESERMTDNTDGGGRRTNRVIPDGVAGNIFPKVSRVDSVYGRVNLRKIYPHINTPSLDVYAGAHFIITDAPDNDRISVLAFSTGSEFDLRNAARDRIESYVISGPVSRMTLYGRQLKGSQAILLYQREEESLPEIGEVYAISTEVGGVTTAQQFVRVQDVIHEVRTFTDDSGDFKRRAVTLKIGSPLREEFQGVPTPSRLSGAGGGGVLRTTTVADAARYFGLQPITAEVSAGTLELTVASVYAPIVPTTQRESPLSLVGTGGAKSIIPTARDEVVRAEFYFNQYETWGPVHLGRAVVPGSLSFSIKANGVNGPTYSVGVDGVTPAVLTPAGSGYVFAEGTVNYETGVVNLRSIGTFTVLYVTYTPGVEVSQTAHTKAIDITLGTRGVVYAVPLLPVPAPGTLILDYRALGKWYRLRDTGTGEVRGGDAAYGAGTIDYVTGASTLTLGALPDVGSSLIFSWGSPSHYQITVDDAGSTAKFSMALPDLPVKRASAVVTYYVGGAAMTASAGLQGLISGSNSVTGSVNHVTGELNLEFGAKLPDSGSVVSVAYHQLVADTPGELPRAEGTFPALVPTVLAGFPFDPGSLDVYVKFKTTIRSGTQYAVCKLYDDGKGNLIVLAGTGMLASWGDYSNSDFKVTADTIVGTINYFTGEVALSGREIAGQVAWWRWSTTLLSSSVGVWVSGPAESCTIDPSLNNTASYVVVGSAVATSESAKTATTTLDASPLVVDLLRTTGRPVIAGSVGFKLTGKSYLDRNGIIYSDLNPKTGSALAVGTIDYRTGLVSLTQWTNNVATELSVQSCLTIKGVWTAVNAFYRTAGSPLRPASLYVQVTAEDGTLLVGSSDQNGYITGAFMRGKVEQSMGVVFVEFGELVTAAGNEAEYWYAADNVEGTMVWRPKPVQPSTLRYSAVVLSNLPLDANILGLDPVRLPSDGRVPIFRPADVAVVHHTGIYNAGTPVAGSTVNVGRAGLSLLWLEDANKKKLASEMYAVDLSAGVATMAADLSLTGYVAPITAKHRIEEMGLLSDVQINGVVTLTAPLLRDFPAGSLLSGALLYGDLQARATNLFDQQTWTGPWQSTASGSGATAQYNDIDYPIEVLNNGAVTERWRLNFTSATAFQVIGENYFGRVVSVG